MMKYIYNHLTQSTKLVGFDIDGTLYDEFDFIEQVYKEIVNQLTNNLNQVYEFMLKRWLLKGSSYPYIFKEAKEKFGLQDTFEKDALLIFRNYLPVLQLDGRTRYVLEDLRKNSVSIFFITDGQPTLQRNKIKSLGIEKYSETIIITGNIPKPNPIYKDQILNRYQVFAEEVLYIGDRDVDKQFAENCGFRFMQV